MQLSAHLGTDVPLRWQIDADGNGEISPNELMLLFHRSGLSVAEVDELMVSMDEVTGCDPSQRSYGAMVSPQLAPLAHSVGVPSRMAAGASTSKSSSASWLRFIVNDAHLPEHGLCPM